MSAQRDVIARLVREKKDSHADPVESMLEWLTELSALLDREQLLEPEVTALVIKHARPQWGVRTVEESHAYLQFWEHLVKRHPQPALRGAYAEEVVRADSARRCEALEVFTEAVKEMPSLFIEHSAAFVEIAEQCGVAGRRQFELAKIRFYVHLVNKNEMEPAELRESIVEVMSTFGESSVRDEMWSIARDFMRA